jgi:AcrR family transcriptional regulator
MARVNKKKEMAAHTGRARAQRMSPDRRREQILDSAVEFIIARGLSNCTLESVAAQASISKALIYKYFPRRDDLLKALVEREYDYLRGRGLDVVPRDVPFDDLVQRANLRSMEYLYERGPIMRLLASDRSVAGLVRRQDRDERGGITNYFVKRLMQVYGLPREVASICAIMTVNAPILSARALKRSGISARRAAEVWSTFTIGGNNAIQAQFGKSNAGGKSKAGVKRTSRKR